MSSIAAPLCVGVSAVVFTRFRRRIDAWRAIVVRQVQAGNSDRDGILSISKGVYIGLDGLSWDYLPYKLDKWFADANKIMFVVESDDFYCKQKGQVAAFDVVSIYDEGETVRSSVQSIKLSFSCNAGHVSGASSGSRVSRQGVRHKSC
jgi:hypothetical protein